MQHIRDKDFDQLFKDKFKDAEVAPSMDLWDKIGPKIQTQRKRALPMLWMAAASVALVISVMLWLSQEEKVQLQAVKREVQPTNAFPLPTSVNTPTVTESIVANRTQDETGKSLSQATATAKVVFVNVEATGRVIVEKNNNATVQPIEGNAHLPIEKEIPKAPVIAGTGDGENAIMYAQANSLTENPDNTGIMEAANDTKKSLRNVGDLVNFVVEKVDRRDRKIVKFDTDDDDNSSIIGLNVGFIKLNKRDR